MQGRKAPFTPRALPMQHSHPKITQTPCGIHSISPASPRFKETAKCGRTCSGHGPCWVAWGLQLLQASCHMATPWPTWGLPRAGGPHHHGSFVGMVSPRGGSHLHTLPSGALQLPVPCSRISDPFNEASGEKTPLKSLRPWEQLTHDPS